MRKLVRLEKTQLPVMTWPLPVPLRVPTPQWVEVDLTTNREEGEEAEVGLKEVSMPGELASREKKRIMRRKKLIRKMIILSQIQEIKETRKSPHGGGN